MHYYESVIELQVKSLLYKLYGVQFHIVYWGWRKSIFIEIPSYDVAEHFL